MDWRYLFEDTVEDMQVVSKPGCVIVRISVARCMSVEFRVRARRENFAVCSGSLVTYSIAQCTCVSTGNLSVFTVIISM